MQEWVQVVQTLGVAGGGCVALAMFLNKRIDKGDALWAERVADLKAENVRKDQVIDKLASKFDTLTDESDERCDRMTAVMQEAIAAIKGTR